MKLSYRSTNLPSGFFNILGSAHIHIDGSQNPDLILGIVKELDAQGHPGKLNVVHNFIAGQQRELLPETYQSHTPKIAGEEALDFFSTNLVKGREDAIQVTNFIGESLGKTPGMIIELEQVVSWLDEKGWNDLQFRDYIQPIRSDEVRFTPSPTEAFELHHGFEIPKNGKPTISLEALLIFCIQKNIMIGGWFIFEKEHTWAYRSNSFTDGKFLYAQMRDEREKMVEFLQKEKIVAQPRVLAEKVIGIWHT